MRAKAEICTCGSRAAEWERDRNAYVAEAVRCLGCELIEQERENVAEMEKDGQFSSKGVSIRLRRPQVDEEA